MEVRHARQRLLYRDLPSGFEVDKRLRCSYRYGYSKKSCPCQPFFKPEGLFQINPTLRIGLI